MRVRKQKNAACGLKQSQEIRKARRNAIVQRTVASTSNVKNLFRFDRVVRTCSREKQVDVGSLFWLYQIGWLFNTIQAIPYMWRF